MNLLFLKTIKILTSLVAILFISFHWIFADGYIFRGIFNKSIAFYIVLFYIPLLTGLSAYLFRKKGKNTNLTFRIFICIVFSLSYLLPLVIGFPHRQFFGPFAMAFNIIALFASVVSAMIGFSIANEEKTDLDRKWMKYQIISMSIILLVGILIYGPYPTKTYTGVFTHEFEGMIFNPNSYECNYWVKGEIAYENAEKYINHSNATNQLKVVWRGKRSSYGSYGHMGLSCFSIEISEVKEMNLLNSW